MWQKIVRKTKTDVQLFRKKHPENRGPCEAEETSPEFRGSYVRTVAVRAAVRNARPKGDARAVRAVPGVFFHTVTKESSPCSPRCATRSSRFARTSGKRGWTRPVPRAIVIGGCCSSRRWRASLTPLVTTWTVNNIATDTHAVNAAAGPWDAGSAISLRSAIEAANAANANNNDVITINIAPLQQGGVDGGGGATNTITLTLGELTLNSNISIIGAGGADGVVQRDSGSGYFRIFKEAANKTCLISNMTIENGEAYNNDGGGILNAGTLSLSNVTMDANQAAAGVEERSPTRRSLYFRRLLPL